MFHLVFFCFVLFHENFVTKSSFRTSCASSLVFLLHFVLLVHSLRVFHFQALRVYCVCSFAAKTVLRSFIFLRSLIVSFYFIIHFCFAYFVPFSFIPIHPLLHLSPFATIRLDRPHFSGTTHIVRRKHRKSVNYLDYVHFATYGHLSNYFIGLLVAYSLKLTNFRHTYKSVCCCHTV